MKKYLLFRYEMYYPSGGMHDFVQDFDSLDDAKSQTVGMTDRYGNSRSFQIVTYSDLAIVLQGSSEDGEELVWR